MDAPDVLVVDDEAAVADTAAEILRTAGFAALTAYDVEGALALAAEHSFKVFVLDHRLGHDTCEPILVNAVHLPPVVIVSAANPDDLTRVARRHKKVYSVKTKPCNPTELIKAVREAIASTEGGVPAAE
jgi:DNA-binding response OmpR family regulator